MCETDFKALQCLTHKFSVHKGVELRGKNFQSMNWFYLLLVFAANIIVNDRPDFYPGYSSGCPELFKLSPISGLLVDESKDYVSNIFLLPSLSAVFKFQMNCHWLQVKHNKPDNSHLL